MIDNVILILRKEMIVMSKAKELQKSLSWEFPHIGKAAAEQKEAAYAYLSCDFCQDGGNDN